jgi:hypothetical protein
MVYLLGAGVLIFLSWQIKISQLSIEIPFKLVLSLLFVLMIIFAERETLKLEKYMPFLKNKS